MSLFAGSLIASPQEAGTPSGCPLPGPQGLDPGLAQKLPRIHTEWTNASSVLPSGAWAGAAPGGAVRPSALIDTTRQAASRAPSCLAAPGSTWQGWHHHAQPKAALSLETRASRFGKHLLQSQTWALVTNDHHVVKGH